MNETFIYLENIAGNNLRNDHVYIRLMCSIPLDLSMSTETERKLSFNQTT